MAAVVQPCDAGVIASTRAAAPCKPSLRPWVIAAAALGSGMAFLDSTVVNVALPAIQADLGATAQDAQWIFGAYALVLAALILAGGSLGDHYGRRRVFALGVALFAAASLWCALAAGPEQLILARAAQGLGGAMMVPGSLAIIGASFDEKLRPKAVGAWAALSGTAMAVGPVLGGFLVESVSWRAAFLINVPLAVAALLIALRHVPESRDPDARRLDIPGAVLAAVGLGGVVYGLIRSSSAGFGDATVLVSLATGLLALAAFVFVEGRSSEPMVPLSLFRSKDFDGASLFTFLFYVALTGSLYFLPFLMVQVHGYSAMAAGSVFLPFVAIAFVVGRLSGRIVARFGARLTLVVASLTAAAGFLLFAMPGVDGGSYWTSFFPAMVVQGFGMALVIAPLTTVALNSVGGPHSGLASGVNNAVTRVAGLLAVAVMGVFVFASFSANLDASLGTMELSAEVREAVEAEKVELGAAEAPEGVGAETAARIEEAVAESFVVGFRLIMLLSAGLALASGLVAALMVEGRDSDGSQEARRTGRASLLAWVVEEDRRPSPEAVETSRRCNVRRDALLSGTTLPSAGESKSIVEAALDGKERRAKMAWLFLLAAGLVEIAFALSIEPTQGFTRPLQTALCFVLGAGSIYLLTHALETLPIGTAYAVFTGIGAIGTVVLGIFLAGDPVTTGRLVPIALIVAGIVALKLFSAA